MDDTDLKIKLAVQSALCRAALRSIHDAAFWSKAETGASQGLMDNYDGRVEAFVSVAEWILEQAVKEGGVE